jgi:Glycosyl hydrolase catalytic core
MTSRLLPLALLLTLLVAAPASAKYRVGIGEQNPSMFDSPVWQGLKLKQVRYIVPWDYALHPGQVAEVDYFMGRARQARQDVLVTFNAPRGCFDGGTYSKAQACRAPKARNFRAAFRAFDAKYPWVKTYSAWNEVNHKSQPTYRSPALAVRYYDVVRKECRKSRCKAMALDLLDERNMSRYLKGFMKRVKGKPRIWGLHNYGDVNRRRTSFTKRILRTVPGEVWLTETGGIVKFDPNFPRSEERAAARTKDMFRMAAKYDSRRRGMRSKITRLYVYKWFGEDPSARFDAGLVNPDGSPRPALATFSRAAPHFR